MTRCLPLVLIMAGPFLCLGVVSCDGELPVAPHTDSANSSPSPAEPYASPDGPQPAAAAAGHWTAKVTGGGMAYNSNTCNVLFQNVSATGYDGTARGQLQITNYQGSGTYPDCAADEIWFQYHAVATDLVIRTAPDGSKVANVCYDVTEIQHQPPMQLTLRFGIAIKEGGRASSGATTRMRASGSSSWTATTTFASARAPRPRPGPACFNPSRARRVLFL